MRKFLAIAALCLATAFPMAAPVSAADAGIAFNDGDVVYWGHNDGVRCTGLCIKSERRGNSVITQAYDMEGKLRATQMHSLVPEPSSKGTSDLVEVHLPGPGVAEVTQPNPPPGGTGPVVVTTVYNTTTGWTVITLTFHFSGGSLVRVDYSHQIFTNNPE
ncbi:MAG: hypothetical protein J0L88_12995 [Xanthomonadales bacterium]|nr:hypothetical protein [Xanthomonadales bacterium]